MSRPILVTSALPNANGPPHFGHLVGAYLPADVFVRYHRLLGHDVRFVCGTDEHGVAITMTAEKEGVPYQQVVDRWWAVWDRVCKRLGIEFDIFSQTSRRDPHYGLATEFFLRLLHNGRLERRDIQQLYSTKTRRYLADRYVRGTCYECGYEDARGDECPKCGSWLEAAKLIDPRSATDPDEKLELRDSWQYELDLAPFADDPAIKPWLDRFRSRLKPNVASFVFDKMIEGEGLTSRPITRDLPWGVPLPEQDLDGNSLGDVSEKVLYVWFDAPIGYVSATIELAREEGFDWRRYWVVPTDVDPADEPRLVHFIGKDNIPFHCIVFPSMLAWQTRDEDFEGRIGPGPGERYVLPENVPANEFFNLEGRKFNKSAGWYLDVEEFLDRYDVDVTRYYLISALPETGDADFLWRQFKAKSDELANNFGNYVSRVLKFVGKYFDGVVPPRVGMDDEWGRVQREISARTEAWGAHIDAYELRRALDEFRGLAADANVLLNELEPWKLRKTDLDACGSALHLALQYLPQLALLGEPFVPGLAAKLRTMLNLPPREPGPALPATWLPVGHQLGEPENLVAKIPQEQIDAELEALQARAGSE